MPELPEVQSTVDYLAPRLESRKIISCSVLWARSIATHAPKVLEKLIVGKQISRVSRRGKYIVIWLESSKQSAALMIHLRMSGCVEVISSSQAKDRHDRVVIHLDNKKELRFNDVRKFGKIYYSEKPQEILGKLGIEPLIPEFSESLLTKMLTTKKGAIKPLLLNQSFIAGIGNIYADESLWLAKIHPRRLANSIRKNEATSLHNAIIKVLNEAIALKGTDNGDYVVEGGLYQPKVYGRSGQACASCGSKIKRIIVGQRSTHFCGKCQKSKGL